MPSRSPNDCRCDSAVLGSLGRPHPVLFFELSQSLIKANVGSEHLLVIDFGLGEHNSPLVQFLLALFGGLAAIFVSFAARFLGLLPLLRFEANFDLLSFLS